MERVLFCAIGNEISYRTKKTLMRTRAHDAYRIRAHTFLHDMEGRL